MGPPGKRGGQPQEKEFDLEQMEQECENMLRLRYINRENAVFKKTPGGFLSLCIDGESYDRIGVYLAFPFSDPDKYVSIREKDDKAAEIGIIEDLNKDVDESTAALLKEQIALRYFTPKIKRVHSIKTEYGFAYFDVTTDAGRCRFTIRMNGGAIVSLTDTRVIISDLDGNRFEIPDIMKLSASELKKIDVFL